MTLEEQFRSNDKARDELRGFLESDLGRTVMLILKDKQTPGRMAEVANMAPSERQFLYAQNQTFQAGWHECLKAMAVLTVPNPEVKQPPKVPALQREFPKQPETK
jgi:aspartate aminotransferase-like enzyme